MPQLSTHVQTEDRQFVRDTHSKALLNTDRAALEKHRAMRARVIAQDTLQERVVRLEEKLNDMHTLLRQTIELLAAR